MVAARAQKRSRNGAAGEFCGEPFDRDRDDARMPAQCERESSGGRFLHAIQDGVIPARCEPLLEVDQHRAGRRYFGL